MKRILPLTLLLGCLPMTATATPWCDGYQEGYTEGYEAVRQVPTFAPACPLPERRTDPNNYQQGYSRGIRDGEAKAEQDCNGRRGSMTKPRGCT